MINHLHGRDFLTLLDFTPAEIDFLLHLSAALKDNWRAKRRLNLLAGKSIALLFEKTSTRTRSAFAVAVSSEGGHPEFLGKNDIQMGKKESVKDTARVLARFFDGIEYRGFEQSLVSELAQYADVPVWNGLTDLYHPTQIMADLLTVQEHFGTVKDKKLVYVGDGRNNVANSLIIGAAKTGMHITIAAPEALWPDEELVEQAQNLAKDSGCHIHMEKDPHKAVKGAHAIYTDVWVSMGEEKKPGIRQRIEQLQPYQENSTLMNATERTDTIFLHCLPAHHTDGVHDMEVTEDVFESKSSLVFDQAENRLHTIKAIIVATIGDYALPL